MKASVKLVSCLLFFILLMTVSCNSPQPTENKSVVPENELVGVWKVTEATNTGPEAGTIIASQPSYLIFTKKHMSSTAILGEAPRAKLPEKPTDAQKAADYDRLIADVSTYEVEGNTFTQHYLVSKDPNTKLGDLWSMEYRIEGGDLILTSKTANPFTLKCVRVE
jgi:hypothetical protein